VARLLDAQIGKRGTRPTRIRVDNSTEFTSKALNRWAYDRGVRLDFTRPGKPTDNAFVEAFNGTLRRECLSRHGFTSFDDVRERMISFETTTMTPARTARGADWPPPTGEPPKEETRGLSTTKFLTRSGLKLGGTGFAQGLTS